MKKLIILMTAAILSTSTAMANDKQGQGAGACTQCATECCFAWGIGLGALVVIGTVVGIIAASASETPSVSHVHHH